MKYFHKNTLLKLASISSLVVIALIIHSCRKDNKQQQFSHPVIGAGIIDPDIPALKTIYARAIGAGG